MSKVGLLAAFTAAITLFGLGYAASAPTTALICSGNKKDALGYGDYGPEGIVVDLDRGVVVWGDDPIPIVKDTGESITFKSLGDNKGKNVSVIPKMGGITKEGSLNRTTGVFQGIITLSPEIAPDPKDPSSYFLLTCKPAKPLF
jgi:hypothetical protein